MAIPLSVVSETLLWKQCNNCTVSRGTFTNTSALIYPFCINNTFPVGTLTCLLSQTYAFNDSSLDILPISCYTQAIPICVSTRIIQPVIAPYDEADCSDPVQRLFDDALTKAQKEPFGYCQNQTITRYHQTLGVGYGLFNNFTPGVDFTAESWNTSHYSLIASIINFKKCDNFDTHDWIKYVESWVENYTSPQVTTNLHAAEYFLALNATFASDVIFVQTIGSDGNVCSSKSQTFLQGDYVFLPCLCKGGCVTMRGFNLIYNWMQGDIVQATFSNLTRSGLVERVKSGIFNTFLFPYNTPLESKWCLNSNQTLDVTVQADQDYLRNFYNVFLAQRKCSQNWHCSQFSLDAYCVFDSYFHQPWYNGGDLPDVSFGIEGGCDCSADTSGFFDDLTFCSSCVEGYGPDTAYEIRAMFDYEDQIGMNWISGGASSVSRCSLPIDPISTRSSTICGGKAWVNRTESNSIFSGKFIDNTYIRRCSGIETGGVIYDLMDVDATSHELITYVNGSQVLNVIHNRVFVNNTEIFDYGCLLRGAGSSVDFLSLQYMSSVLDMYDVFHYIL